MAFGILALISVLQATPTLPAPTGSHPVGVRLLSFSDRTRPDTLSSGSTLPRRVLVQIWYPASSPSKQKAPYAPFSDKDTSGYATMLRSVVTHSSIDPPAAHINAPVLLFAPGRSAAAYDYTALAEDLASHGYVLVGVNSPQSSRFWDEAGQFHPTTLAAPTMAMLQNFARADSFLEQSNRLISGDLRFVHDEIARIVKTDPILKDLTLGPLGLGGHSNGAMGAARACAQLTECRAFLGIEGTQTREVREHGVNKPFGLLISDLSLSYDKEDVYTRLGRSSPMNYTVFQFHGAGHNSSTDLLLIRPDLFNYDIAPNRGVTVARQVVRAFFDEHLRRFAASNQLPSEITIMSPDRRAAPARPPQ